MKREENEERERNAMQSIKIFQLLLNTKQRHENKHKKQIKIKIQKYN